MGAALLTLAAMAFVPQAQAQMSDVLVSNLGQAIAIGGTQNLEHDLAQTFTTDEDTAYAFDAADFNFSDTDADDTLAAVNIVTLPTKGTLALSGTAVTAGESIDRVSLDAGNLFLSAAVGMVFLCSHRFLLSVDDELNLSLI